MFFFFFFKQKTEYEMRSSDWSSDVCSSDLHHHRADDDPHPVEAAEQPREGDLEHPDAERHVAGEAGDERPVQPDPPDVGVENLGKAGAQRGDLAFGECRDGCGHAICSLPMNRWRMRAERSEEHTSELQSLMRSS